MFINIVLCALRQQQTNKKCQTKCNKTRTKKPRKVCDVKIANGSQRHVFT